MDRLVELSDQEVRIDFKLGCKCLANVRLKSLKSTPIAYKVQTSSPHKFLVNPPTGLIPPLSYATFQIILKPQSHPPSSFPLSPSDRFLIKTAPFTEFTNSSESINSWFSSRSDLVTHNLKLKVAYVGLFLLRYAVSGGEIDSVKSIIKRQNSIVADLSTRDAESLYRVATESCNSERMINLLMEAGLKTELERVKVDNLNGDGLSNGWTEIHAAAAFDQIEKLSRLIGEACERGGPLDCRDRKGRTPLHLAASKGNLRCAKVLVEAGADKNAKSQDGRTALYRSVENGDRPMVELLMEMGVDPTIPTAVRGRSAIEAARDKGHKEIVEILEQGASMLTAARRGDLRLLELLLRNGSTRANHSDQYGLTSLHAAAIKGHKDAVFLLIEFGTIDLECQDREGHTALHLAVEGGSIETVKVLVNKGANINAKSKRGATPLYMARALGYDDISQFLLHKGASSSSSSPTSPSSLSSAT
ncbi:MSP domain [Macleaya cordata]|uniref:MSP domain n=1 Tax=Macleaya cordata TaxID=56857 RepID=A0A200PLS1_MACCD|nr:MSP domain [Macleaya cordata]